jgi:hypothetical protein
MNIAQPLLIDALNSLLSFIENETLHTTGESVNFTLKLYLAYGGASGRRRFVVVGVVDEGKGETPNVPGSEGQPVGCRS